MSCRGMIEVDRVCLKDVVAVDEGELDVLGESTGVERGVVNFFDGEGDISVHGGRWLCPIRIR